MNDELRQLFGAVPARFANTAAYHRRLTRSQLASTTFVPSTWSEHFRLEAGRVVGITVVGRVTVDVLRINLPERLEHRRLLAALGVLMT